MADRTGNEETFKMADSEQQCKYPKSTRNGEHRPKRGAEQQRAVENCRRFADDKGQSKR